jgi:hypothetical protein
MYSAVVLACCINSCGYAAYWQQCRVNFVIAVVFCVGLQWGTGSRNAMFYM